ncbi:MULTISPECIES: transferase [unclassified Kitasatospora]|uniref:transferase n=1 Tax=unclassified Kitasatospora TaxID=2633591 RepID=UPI0033D5F9A7
MSSRLRNFARLVTGLTVLSAYVALHLLVSVGMGQQMGRNATLALWFGAPALVLLGPVLWLRHRRRSGAAELVRIVSRYVPRRQPWHRALRLANGLGLMLFGGGFYAVTESEKQGHKMPLEAQFLLLFGGLAALAAGFLILRRTRPYAARPAARALLLSGRQPVLYLRSFGDDDSAAQVDDVAEINLHTREEQLAGALGAVGPVIAVGRPEERLPHLGAARFYLPLDDWKPTVLRLMDLSQLIVLCLGQGDGLWWEVEQARTTQPAKKLVLLVPGGAPSDLVARLSAYLPEPVPSEGSGTGEHWISAVIVFDDSWTPRVFPVGLRLKGWRGWNQRASLGARETPAAEVARAVGTALASSGPRRRTMVLRAWFVTHIAAQTGFGLVVAVVLAGWLGYRALQLIGLW